ncbi:hypothetical protein BASA83_010533 [Batrachochytrium salamandrivorans]|nr:hypothetical protein BASA83_010533 [Batrachochytrium salamandrivorans]
MWRTVSFYVTSLCPRTGYWDTPGWSDIIPGLIGCRGWSTLTRLTVWKTVPLGQLGPRDLENPQQSDNILPLNPEPMEPCVQDISDLGKSYLLVQYLRGTWILSIPMSTLSGCFSGLPTRRYLTTIFKEFTSVFSKKQSEKLPIHQCSGLSIGKVFTTLDLRGAYNLLRTLKRVDEPKLHLYKVWQFEFLVMPSDLQTPRQFQRMMNTRSEIRLENTPFSWGADQEKSISELKKAFSNSSFLAHPCDSKPFMLETDASDFAISGVLSQFDDLDQIRPVAFYARQMNSAERKL